MAKDKEVDAKPVDMTEVLQAVVDQKSMLSAILSALTHVEIKPVAWLETHSPVFLQGKNLGLKIDGKAKTPDGKKSELRMEHHRSHVADEVHIWYNNGAQVVHGVVFSNNINSMNYFEAPAPQEAVVRPTLLAQQPIPGPAPRVSAQVSGPTHHVFAGLGHGKAR